MRLVVLAVVVLSGCSSGPDQVSRDQMGDRWPLTVDRGRVECRGPGYYFVDSDGKRYGLNGFAGDARDIDPIWDKPKSLGPLTEVAAEQC